MTALVGLLTTLLILEGTGFGSVDVETHPLLGALLLLGTPLAGGGIALALARRDVSAWQRRRLLRGFYLLAYLVTYAAIIYLAGWGDFVLVRLGWLGQPVVSHALLVLPAGLVALWAALWFYRADGQLLTRSGREARRFLPWVARRARLIVIPAGVFAMAIAVTQCVGLIPSLGLFLEIYPSMAVLVGLVLLVLVIVVFPRLVLLAWPSRPLPPGHLRTSLEELATRVGVKVRDVRVWERTATLVNACIIGHFSGGRHVLFTGGAREQLGDDDLRAVFAHEISHITSGHLWCYSSLLVAYLLALSPLEQSLRAAPPWVLGLAFLGITAAMWLVLFGYLSRRMETEADIRGAGLVPDGTYLAAFDRVRRLLGSSISARGGWRHFSLDRRSEILRSVLAHPEARRAPLAACRRWKLTSYALLLVAISAFLWSASRDFARPESLLALDRGEYALGQAGDLKRVLETRDGDVGTPTWASWLVRGSTRVEREYSETLARARTSLQGVERAEGSGDPATDEEASALRATLEEHLAWWESRGS